MRYFSGTLLKKQTIYKQIFKLASKLSKYNDDDTKYKKPSKKMEKEDIKKIKDKLSREIKGGSYLQSILNNQTQSKYYFTI